MKMARSTCAFTLDPEVVNLLDKADNKSGLINQLILNHFNYIDSDDEVLLNKKKLEVEEKIDILNKELEHVTNRLIILNQNKQRGEKEEMNKEQILLLRKEVELLKEDWHGDKISDDEYWEKIDEYQKLIDDLKK